MCSKEVTDEMNDLCCSTKFFSEDVLTSLKKRSIFTLNDFLKLDNRQLQRITSLTFLEIVDIKKQITKVFSSTPLNGLKYYEQILSHSAIISTGFVELDKLLQGGLFTGTIYEVCGPPDIGKTFFILNILKELIAQNDVIFIDTKNEFSGKLFMKNLLKILGNKERCLEVMKKIVIRPVFTKYELINALFDIKKDLESGSTVRIIIIHYLPTLFLSSNDITENNHILNHCANVLRYLAHHYHLVIVTTNLTTTWAKGDFKCTSEITEKVSCGKYWGSIPNIRLKLNRERDNLYKISLLKNNTVDEYCFVNINIE